MKKDIFKEVREEWSNYLETENKINKGNFDTEGYDFGDLFECYKVWRGEEGNKGILKSYQIAVKLLKEHKIPSLSEREINEFTGDTEINKPIWNGIFVSAIINELYRNEEIHLSSDKINYLGCCNEDKKIVIEGDCGNWIGEYMKGGELVIEGDCEAWTGSGMKGGTIKIYSEKFDPEKQISNYAEKGEIYHKDKLVWKDGELLV